MFSHNVQNDLWHGPTILYKDFHMKRLEARVIFIVRIIIKKRRNSSDKRLKLYGLGKASSVNR